MSTRNVSACALDSLLRHCAEFCDLPGHFSFLTPFCLAGTARGRTTPAPHRRRLCLGFAALRVCGPPGRPTDRDEVVGLHFPRREHRRRGAGIQAVAVYGYGQQRGQGRAAGGLAECSHGNHHPGHRTRTRRSVHLGWVGGRRRDGDWPGKRARQAGPEQRRSAVDERDSA
jgi:hypothetical protein